MGILIRRGSQVIESHVGKPHTHFLECSVCADRFDFAPIKDAIAAARSLSHALEEGNDAIINKRLRLKNALNAADRLFAPQATRGGK